MFVGTTTDAKKLILLVASFSLAWCETVDDVDALSTDLFTGYNKNSRPIEDQSKPMLIKMIYFLISIMEFDEIKGKLTTAAAFALYWEDSKITWKPENYSYLYYFSVPASQVWIPEFIVVMNPSEKIDSLTASWQYVHYYHNGTASWYPGSILSTACSVDVSKFPFDTQKCNLEFMPWGFGTQQINLTNLQDHVDLTKFIESGTWNLKSTKAETYSLPTNEQEVIYTLELERRSSIYVINVIIPIFLLSFLNSLVFILPVDSGERVSYSVTVLLAVAVFMTIVSDSLPKTVPVPVIAIILMTDLAISVIITIITIISMHFHFQTDDAKIPKILKRLLSKKAHVSCIRMNSVSPGEQDKDIAGSRINVMHINHFQQDEVVNGVSWKDVGGFFDKICFVIFTIGYVALVFVYLLIVMS